MAETLDPNVLSGMPARTRERKDPQYADDIRELVTASRENPNVLRGVPAGKDDVKRVRSALYSAAKFVGVKLRTWDLNELEKNPQPTVAFRLKADTESAAGDESDEAENTDTGETDGDEKDGEATNASTTQPATPGTPASTPTPAATPTGSPAPAQAK